VAGAGQETGAWRSRGDCLEGFLCVWARGFVGAQAVGRRFYTVIFNPGGRNCEGSSFDVLLVLCVVKCFVP